MSEISSMFIRDVRERKRISRHSTYKRKHRWIDGTTGKTQKELLKLNSETRVYIMDNLLNREEFYALDLDMQKKYMEHWRATKETTEIRKSLDLSAGGFYSLLKRLELPTNIKGRFGRGVVEQKQEDVKVEEIKQEVAEVVYPEVVEEVLESMLEFTDKDTGEAIAKKLNAIMALINDKGKYQMTLSLKSVKMK